MYQTGQSDPIYDYLKNVIGGKVTKKRYMAFDWPDGPPEDLAEEELIPAHVLPLLEDEQSTPRKNKKAKRKA
jgi:glycerol-3-phosphate dehydrogenase